ncbi:MAG: TIGR00701 family protein, partial [Gammaproteobacteria bacterium]|nr:TIGR00701 family protein [Gammaproteobacteria bacterium]
KAFHIIFLVMWFAGWLYLPRLFVYHAQSDDAVSLDRFKIMERKLFAIMTVGGVLTLTFAAWMLHLMPNWLSHNWMHAKIGLVLVLVAYHLYCFKLVKDFKHNKNTKSHVFYRWFNELPAVLLIVIVLLVELKPF